MQEDVLKSATNDIKLIKDVIASTSNSIVSLKTTFLLFGLLYLAVGISTLFSHVPRPGGMLTVIIFISIVISCNILILIRALRTPMGGLCKQLVWIWIWIFTFVEVENFFHTFIFPNIIHTYNFDSIYIVRALQLIAYSFGFVCMCVFSRLKLPGFFALVYAAIGLLCAIPNGGVFVLLPHSLLSNIPGFSYMPAGFSDLIAFLIPATFFIIGFYLYFIEARRMRLGYTLDS